MSDDLLPQSAASAYLRGLKAADETGVRVDEDYVGLPLAEPFAAAVPGLAIPLFPTAGRIPGGPNLVYPVRLVIRVALLSDDIRFGQVTQPVVRAEGPQDSLGNLDDLASLGITDRQNLRRQYLAMLDRAAAATAGGASDEDVRERIRDAFERLREEALATSYAVVAPNYFAWLYRR
jgi:hypothetical protein